MPGSNLESPRRVLDRIAEFIAVVVALASASYLLRYGIAVAGGDITEIRGQEPLILAGITKTMSGFPLYTPVNAPPFDLMQYTPLYYYLVACVSSVMGIGPDEVARITGLGRFISLGFAIVDSAVLLLILRRFLRVRLLFAAIATALVWMLHAPWDFMARPDALVSLCFTCAVGLTILGLRRERMNYRSYACFAAAAFLGFTAFLAKQNGAQICVVLMLFFLIRREWRAAIIVGVSSVLPLILVIALGPRIFGIDYADNVVGGLNNGVRVHSAVLTTYIPVFLEYNMAALSAAGAYVVIQWSGRGASLTQRFLAFALTAVFVLAAFSASKLGSATHHYNDFMTLLVLCLAFWLDGISSESSEKARAVRWAVAAFSVLYFANTTVAFRDHYNHSRWIHFSDYDGAVNYLEKELAAHPDKQFFTIDYTLPSYFPGRAIIPQYSLSAIMHARGLVDYSEAQAMMHDGTVRWLLLGNGQNPQRQLGFVGIDPGHYVHERQLGGFSVWIHPDGVDAPTTDGSR